ncbi:MAG: 1-acyl-sn-glycerol-3-phosphate acyltransferase [Opitutales bacterium]|nr:1-acyl-sn-glycerol-3-phosphate acyltransferase [Opitutales bacterium]
MRLLRSVLTALFFAIFGIGGFFLGVLVIPAVSLFSRKKAVAVLRASWRLFVAGLEFFRLIKLNKANVNPDRSGYVIVANHPSLLDIVLLVATYKNSICIVKKSLLNNILLYPIIRRIFIVSGGSATQVMADAAKALEIGLNVIIFPEGTRSDNSTKKIHRGAARIATSANRPVLPARISCSPLILGKKSKPLDVSDRTVLYTIEELEEIPPCESIGLNNSKKSRLLTAKIANVLNLE